MNKLLNLTKKKIGILGGGQLAQMLLQQGQKIGLDIHVMSESEMDPAALVSTNWQKGRLKNVNDVLAFASRCDVLTFESEFIGEDVLKALIREKRKSYPHPELLLKLQDRREQKYWLEENLLTSSNFVNVSKALDLRSFFHKTKSGIVLKKRRFGYDGYGTYVLKTNADLERWLKKNQANLADYIAEAFVPFSKEMAVTLVRSGCEQIITFPLVEWRAKDAKCHWVKGPIECRRDYPLLLKKIKKALNKSNYIGAITFELFLTKNKILVNEVAPRVHNSCHYSIEALNICQFNAHLLALTGHNLPKPKLQSAASFAMVNLIGESNTIPQLAIVDNGFLHWYGKNENRSGRKMGHITCLGDSPEHALRDALRLEKRFRL